MNDDRHEDGAQLFLCRGRFVRGVDGLTFAHDEHALARAAFGNDFVSFAEVMPVGAVKVTIFNGERLISSIFAFAGGTELARGQRGGS